MKGFQVRMKKAITFSILTIFALVLTACGSGASALGQNNGNASAQLPESAKLLIGTLKLDGTPQAVSAQQAAQLIPLWQLYASLETSSTAASQEIDATVQQIQATMTAAQLQAIDNMNITRSDEFTTLQQMGLASANASGTPAPGGTRTQGQGGGGSGSGGFNRGGFGGGGFGGGGNPGGGGQGNGNFNPSQIATAQAARAAGGGANRIPSALINALIQFLQKKAGS
jgi:uncharacterized membrane protein YgcG